MLKYLLPVVFGAILSPACNVGFRDVHEKHARVIKEELNIFIDTVKAISICQAWTPGKEGEPDIYVNHHTNVWDSSNGTMDLIVAGKKELKVICCDDSAPHLILDTILIPYLLIDHVEYQSSEYSHYVGQDITLYLSRPIGQDTNDP